MSVKKIAVCGMAWLWSAISLAGAAGAPLADAAERMDRTGVRALLGKRLDVNASQVDGTTALHWAVLHDDLEMAKLLVLAGANVNAANRYGVMPLTLACTNGNAELVELLLDRGASPNTTGPGGETVLMTAARTGRIGAVKALLARGADVHTKIKGMGRQDGAGATSFLIRMADPTIFDFQTKADQTALMWAAAEGHADVVEELIKHGADFRAILPSGFSPLLFAVREDRLAVVKTLVKAGVDVNKKIEPIVEWRHPGYDARLKPGSTPLQVAVENGNFELAAYLLEVGANAGATDGTGTTVLHAIAGARRVALGDDNPPPEPSGNMTSLEFVRKLAAHGANVNAKSRAGLTPFLMAAQNSDIEFMKTLVAVGADPLLRDRDNNTALMLVGGRIGTEEEALEATKLALELGIDINALNNHGETAMHAAASKNQPEMIKLLAKRGAKIEVWNRENKYGSTPLAIAVGYRRPGIFRPQPRSEAAIRELMIAAGITPPEKVTVPSRTQQSN